MRWELRLYSNLKKYKNQYIPLLIVGTRDFEDVYWHWLSEDNIKIYKKNGFWNVDFDYILNKRNKIAERIQTSELGLYFALKEKLGDNLKWIRYKKMKFSEIPLLYEFKFPQSIWSRTDNCITDSRYRKSDDLESIIEVGRPSIHVHILDKWKDILCKVYVFDAKLNEYYIYKHSIEYLINNIKKLNDELNGLVTVRDGLKKQIKEDFNYEVM